MSSVKQIAIQNIDIIEELKKEGKLSKELADVLLKNTSANKLVYNSIELVVEDVRNISQKVDSVEAKVVSLETSISDLKQSVDGSLKQNRESQEKISELLIIREADAKKELIADAKKEMFSQISTVSRNASQFILLIATTFGVLWAIWKYLVQSAL